MNAQRMSGAGNAFLVMDAREAESADLGAAARTWCETEGVDGLVIVGPADEADCSMVVYNADGSRPEACGNGLRCAALFAREQGAVERDEMLVATDAGPRRVTLLRDGDQVTAAQCTMGEAQVREECLELEGSRCVVVRVDLGNAHCVAFVDSLRGLHVEHQAQALGSHERFPDGVNVEMATRIGDDTFVARVWERGVGETAACGTGACAIVAAAERQGAVSLPASVIFPGGELEVDRDPGGEWLLRGPVER